MQLQKSENGKPGRQREICDMDLGNWAPEGGGTGPRVMGEPPSRTTLADILSLL